MYKCDFCSRVYTFKKHYTKHFSICKEYHKMQMENDVDRIEYNPTTKELYLIIKELTYKCNELEKEVKILKTFTSTNYKKNILTYLNDKYSTDYSHFSKWINEIEVNQTHLNQVFQDDLNQGFKSVMSIYFKSTTIVPKIPICCFLKKPNQFYIFELDSLKSFPVWRKMIKPDFEKLLTHISEQFLLEFIKWQSYNKESIDSSDKLKEDEIHYMMKINCTFSSMDKRIDVFKKWLFVKLQNIIPEYN
jgi:hypothetical protein